MEKEEIEALIQKISSLRIKNNLSARKLSELIGKNYGYINKLENTKSFLPTVDTLFDILEVCNTTPEEFFYNNPNDYKMDKEIIDLLSSIDEESKKSVLTLLKKIKKYQ